MIHFRLPAALLCVVTLSHPWCAFAGSRRLSPEDKACAVSRAQVTRFLNLDARGARLAPDRDVANLLRAPQGPLPRPLVVTREKEIISCSARENATQVIVRVRYLVLGILKQPDEGSSMSVYVPGKGSHDRVFKLTGSKAKFKIANAHEIMPHVSVEVAAGELRKELALAKNDIEKGAIEGAIVEIER